MSKDSSPDLNHLSESELMEQLDTDLLPKHVAVIMDGNGRWAEIRGLPRIAGHREGINSVRELLRLCGDLGIGALTIYAFSLENWNRPQFEIAALMELLEHFLEAERHTLIEKGVQVRANGRIDLLPPAIAKAIRVTEEQTAHLNKIVLTVCLSYGGRAEIVDAARKMVKDCAEGKLSVDQIDESHFEQNFRTYGLPDPDLLIRTSGESRISNFLLWQLAYTELYFTPTLWPDFRRCDALIALLEYQQRERRFGRVHSTVSSHHLL